MPLSISTTKTGLYPSNKHTIFEHVSENRLPRKEENKGMQVSFLRKEGRLSMNSSLIEQEALIDNAWIYNSIRPLRVRLGSAFFMF